MVIDVAYSEDQQVLSPVIVLAWLNLDRLGNAGQASSRSSYTLPSPSTSSELSTRVSYQPAIFYGSSRSAKADLIPQHNLPEKTSKRYNGSDEAGCPYCSIQSLVSFSERGTIRVLRACTEARRSSFYFVTSILSSPTRSTVHTTRSVDVACHLST